MAVLTHNRQAAGYFSSKDGLIRVLQRRQPWGEPVSPHTANNMKKPGSSCISPPAPVPTQGFVLLQANNKQAAASPGFTLTEEGHLPPGAPAFPSSLTQCAAYFSIRKWTTSKFFTWNEYDTDKTSQMEHRQITIEWRNNSRKNEEMEPKQKKHPGIDVTRGGSKVQ